MDYELSKSLYVWAKGNSGRVNNLKDWQTDALGAIVANNGAQVASTGANGVNVSFSSKGMTNQEWFNTLTKALQMLEDGGVRKTSIGYIV